MRRLSIVSIIVSLIFLFGSFVSVFALPSFYDDFSSGTLDKWEVLRGNWSIVNGELSQNDLVADYCSGQIAIKDLSSRDFIVEAKVKFVELVPKEWAYVGFAVRYSDANTFYWIVLKQTADANGQPNSNLRLELRAQFRYLVVVDLGFFGELNTFYSLKAEVKGTSFKIYVNDVLKIEHTDSTFQNSGRILMWAGRCRARYDNVLVVNPIENVVPEPGPFVVLSIFIVAFAAYVKISKRKMPRITLYK